MPRKLRVRLLHGIETFEFNADGRKSRDAHSAMVLTPTRLPRSHDGLCACSHLQFAEDIRDVVPYRLRAEDEALGDFRIGQVLRDEGKYFLFSLRQFREGLDGRC